MIRLRRWIQDDSGASAMVIAFSMILLMGVTALVTDVGAGFNERRQDQSAADASVLGGALEMMINTTSSNVLQAATDQAKVLVDANLSNPVDPLDWTNCTDPNALQYPSDTIPGVVGGSNCISFGDNDEGVAFAQMRVRVPTRSVATSFGRVLGVDFLQTSAAGEASIFGTGASGSFPAAVFNGTTAGADFCIKTGNGNASHQACGDPTTGDFGNFQPYFYKEVGPGPQPTECTSGNQTDPLALAMANGIDHFLGVTPAVPGARENGDDCPQFPGPAFPNRVDSGSGYSPNDVTSGLVSGGTYDALVYQGRLAQKIWGGPYGPATIFGTQIDNRPLWTYIDPLAVAPMAVPDTCKLAAGGPNTRSPDPVAFDKAKSDLIDCLQDPSVPSELFTTDIYQTPRLTVVPEYHQLAAIGNNSCCYDIKDFAPIFIQSVWTAHGPQWTCNGVEEVPGDYCRHEAGADGIINVPAVGQRKLSSADAIVISCELLPGDDIPPEERCKKIDSGNGNQVSVFVDLELTR